MIIIKDLKNSRDLNNREMLKTEVNTFIGKKGNPVYNGIKKARIF